MATPSPARPILLPPNPAIVRLLGQRGQLGRGVRAKLLRCSALWGFPFGAARAADAVRSFIALRDMAEPMRWRLPPALAAAFAEPEEGTPAVPGAAEDIRAEPHAQRTGVAAAGNRTGRNAEFAAEPHAQRSAPTAPPPDAGEASGLVHGGNAQSPAEPHAQRTGAAEPSSRAGRNPEFAAEPHARRYAPAAPPPAAGAAGGPVRGGNAESRTEPHAQRYARPARADGHTTRQDRNLGKEAVGAGAKPRHDAFASPLASVASPASLASPASIAPPASLAPQAALAAPASPAAPAPNPRQNSMPSGNRGWLKNGATPGDFLAAPRCLARTRAARTIHGAYAASERARILPLRSFIRRSQIFYDLWRLEAELPASARARLPALPPELSMPPDLGASPPVPSCKQERADAAAEAARLAPWRLAIQAARAQRREGAVPPPLLAAVDQAFASLPPNQPLGVGTG